MARACVADPANMITIGVATTREIAMNQSLAMMEMDGDLDRFIRATLLWKSASFGSSE